MDGWFDQYIAGASTSELAWGAKVSVSHMRRVLKAESLRRGYAPGLRLDELRKKRRKVGKRSKYDMDQSAFGDCRLCGRGLRGHLRCKRCAVLLHGVNTEYTCGCGVQHGVHAGDGLCVGCARVGNGDKC